LGNHLVSRLSAAWGRYHKENRFLVAVFVFLMVLSVGAFYLLQSAKESSPEELTNRVLLFVLWYLDISLIQSTWPLSVGQAFSEVDSAPNWCSHMSV
jgi:hypothetical protein